MKNKCIICGKEFDGIRYNKPYTEICSEECFNENYRREMLSNNVEYVKEDGITMEGINTVIKDYLDELEIYKLSFSYSRYIWLKGITKDSSRYKICCAMGYVMAVRDSGNNIGNIKLYLETLFELINIRDTDWRI